MPPPTIIGMIWIGANMTLLSRQPALAVQLREQQRHGAELKASSSIRKSSTVGLSLLSFLRVTADMKLGRCIRLHAK